MYPSINFSRGIKLIAVLSMLLVASVAAAQLTSGVPLVSQRGIDQNLHKLAHAIPQAVNCQPGKSAALRPQWVLDRQQYETNYVYVAPQPVNCQPAACRPQWAIDRQQYETTYRYAPSQPERSQTPVDAGQRPQWVIDRQQYETTYIYVSPPSRDPSADTGCASGSRLEP